MGYRAIRICLNQPEIFKTQLRALLRASGIWKSVHDVSDDHFHRGSGADLKPL